MIEIAPGNGAILIKSFLMQIKQPLKACFAFPRLLLAILSYIVPRPLTLLGSQPGCIINRKLETESTRRVAFIFGSSF